VEIETLNRTRTGNRPTSRQQIFELEERMNWIEQLRREAFEAQRAAFAEKFRKIILADWQSLTEEQRENVRAAARKQEARRQRAKSKRQRIVEPKESTVI
jgi:hypothetical protein